MFKGLIYAVPVVAVEICNQFDYKEFRTRFRSVGTKQLFSRLRVDVGLSKNRIAVCSRAWNLLNPLNA